MRRPPSAFASLTMSTDISTTILPLLPLDDGVILPNMAIAIAITSDEARAAVDDALHRVLGDLARHPDAVHRVEVGPLSPSALAELAAGSGVDPARLLAVTGGNAFFAAELIASGGAVSVNVRDAVVERLERLARLDPGAREVAEVVSTDARGLVRSVQPLSP